MQNDLQEIRTSRAFGLAEEMEDVEWIGEFEWTLNGRGF